jgi:excisionase family DNA binding protein
LVYGYTTMRRPMRATVANPSVEGRPLTISVIEAGKRLGLGKQASYDAAHRGELPVIRMGRRLLVPIAAFEAMLAVKSKQEIVAAELVRRLQEGGDA